MAGSRGWKRGVAAILMTGVDYLLGSADLETRPLRVYDDEACAYVADMSRELMKDPEAKALPDVTALAFWGRPARIKKLREAWPAEEARLGRGLAFHIAPANVPVNFAFSFIFSLLAGNANLVRVPSRPFAQTRVIIRALKKISGAYPAVAARTALVSYAAEDVATEAFCARADVRVIWGGDETVARIRAMKCKPRCLDICFPDRYSFAVLDGAAVGRAEGETLKTLARNFYNDAYLLDQNACSAPRLVIWRDASKANREKFWSAVADEAEARYDLPAAAAMEKFNRSCLDAVEMAENLAGLERWSNLVCLARLNKLPPAADHRLRGSYGYFYEIDLTGWDDLKDLVTEKCQTVTYYGLAPELILDFVIKEGLTGIDRIVPVGSALDIGLLWDGYDLIRSFSRLVAAS